jgi:hypothetical protein
MSAATERIGRATRAQLAGKSRYRKLESTRAINAKVNLAAKLRGEIPSSRVIGN